MYDAHSAQQGQAVHPSQKGTHLLDDVFCQAVWYIAARADADADADLLMVLPSFTIAA